ncbi:hypothetical protein RN001_003922 [Aquatica leii]|uniref:EF-hand domain-containing protein n=1 Tax=Aquatica leii TaxID=1421715 RepID=A0AAN7PPF8_9COLE|nr:hypothetical protein RN001_003922 [Aquatica leii]
MSNRYQFLKDLLGSKTYLNETEYIIYNVVYTGQVPNDAEINLMFFNANLISRKDANVIISKKLVDKESIVLETFRAFDTDCKGYIDTEDLKNAWKSTLPNLSWEILHNSFRQIAEDDVLDYKAFKIYFLSSIINI